MLRFNLSNFSLIIAIYTNITFIITSDSSIYLDFRILFQLDSILCFLHPITMTHQYNLINI